MSNYDLIVIGAGPAGYVAAIYASQCGLKTALIERNPTLGGTCLNVGCIPTKAMLFSALSYDKAKKFSSYGVKIGNGNEDVTLDFPQVMKRKTDIVKQFTGGIAGLCKKYKVEVISGTGRIAAKGQVEVTDKDGRKNVLATKNIMLATGSRVREIPLAKIDGKDIISSDHILSLEKIPQSLAVIGGGVVGSEFASCYGRFGTKVAIFEMADQIVPSEDFETAAELTKALKKQNVEIFTGVKVASVKSLGGKVEVRLEGEKEPRIFEKALISIGRSPVTEDIGLDKVGIKTDRGFIPVDLKTFKTSAEGIYAVGDIIPTPQLAHTASAEAIFAVDIMCGKKRAPIDYMANPGAIYTYPEIASVGYTEQALKKEGKPYKVGKFPFVGIAKAKIDDCTEGFVKILVDTKYGEILGVHIVNAKATELISEYTVGKTLETTIEEMAHAIHPHPTLSEVNHEAAHAAMGHSIHF